MKKIVSINTDILLGLKGEKINTDEAILYLLSIYFNLNGQNISPLVKTQVNALKIVEREYKDEEVTKIIWKVPLFQEEKDDNFAWISEWMDSFGRINPSRKGTKSAVNARMKKFFAEHPEVRVQDVFAATQAYFKTVRDPQYLKSSHKFIMEGSNFSKISLLEQYVDQVKAQGVRDGRNSKVK